MAVMERGCDGIVSVAVQPADGPQNQGVQEREEEPVQRTGHPVRRPSALRKARHRKRQKNGAQRRVQRSQMEQQQVVRGLRLFGTKTSFFLQMKKWQRCKCLNKYLSG